MNLTSARHIGGLPGGHLEPWRGGASQWDHSSPCFWFGSRQKLFPWSHLQNFLFQLFAFDTQPPTYRSHKSRERSPQKGKEVPFSQQKLNLVFTFCWQNGQIDQFVTWCAAWHQFVRPFLLYIYLFLSVFVSFLLQNSFFIHWVLGFESMFSSCIGPDRM